MSLQKFLFFIAALGINSVLFAQESILDKLKDNTSPTTGTITIHQDIRLDKLIGRPRSAQESNGEQIVQKISGFRVQVYAGNNSKQARSEAYKIGTEVQELFPELQVYTQFISPRWLCRVGDYRTIEEADVVMRQLKATGMFKEISIVRSIIILN